MNYDDFLDMAAGSRLGTPLRYESLEEQFRIPADKLKNMLDKLETIAKEAKSANTGCGINYTLNPVNDDIIVERASRIQKVDIWGSSISNNRIRRVYATLTIEDGEIVATMKPRKDLSCDPNIVRNVFLEYAG